MRLSPSVLAIAALLTGSAGSAAPSGRPGLGPSAVTARRFEAADLVRPHARLLRGRSGESLTGATAAGVEDVARAFVAAEIGPPGDLALVRVVEGAGGVRFVTLEQRFDDVPVVLGRVTVAVAT